MSFDLPNLPEEWTYAPLDSLSQPNSVTYGVVQPGTALEAGKPLIRVNNFRDTRIDLADVMYIEPEIEAKYSRTRLNGGEVLITIVGSVGQVAVVPSRLSGFNVARAVAVIHPLPHIAPEWIALCLRSPLSQHLLGSRANTTVQTTINLKDLRALPIPLPPSEVRQGIADFVGALDDRITLLRETNATLEAIAQALFKSWFVDFDPVRAKMDGRAPEGMDEATAALFPDSFEETALGVVPKGWRVATLHDCCKKIESGGTPKRTVAEFWKGSISWLTSGEVRNPIVFDTKEKITESGVSGSSAKLWPAGTTVVAMYGATAGEVCLIASPMTANQACCGLIPQDDFRAFLFFCARREREDLASKSSGSAQQNLNKGLVEQHQVIRPTNGVVAAFEMTIGTMLDRWIECELHAQTLSTIRDTLLPRLISGQLRLPEVTDAN